jgi:hypothetical protein
MKFSQKRRINMSIKKKFLSRISFLIIILIILPIFAFPYIFGNGSGSGYGEGEGDAAVGCTSIEVLVVQGAGYYLNAYSEVLSFLNRVELSGSTDNIPVEWDNMLQHALTSMFYALATYDQLILMADSTPYNTPVISQLINFAYDRYMSENQLNPVIFQEVQGFLGEGDITGLYKQIREDLWEIAIDLLSVHYNVVSGKMPPMSQLWKLNEMSSHTLIFGQYVARVFAAL